MQFAGGDEIPLPVIRVSQHPVRHIILGIQLQDIDEDFLQFQRVRGDQFALAAGGVAVSARRLAQFGLLALDVSLHPQRLLLKGSQFPVQFLPLLAQPFQGRLFDAGENVAALGGRLHDQVGERFPLVGGQSQIRLYRLLERFGVLVEISGHTEGFGRLGDQRLRPALT